MVEIENSDIRIGRREKGTNEKVYIVKHFFMHKYVIIIVELMAKFNQTMQIRVCININSRLCPKVLQKYMIFFYYNFIDI